MGNYYYADNAEFNEFNIERAVKAVDAYSKSTGIGCIIIDKKGVTLYSNVKDNNVCEIIKHAEGLQGIQMCAHAHLYGSYQAERFGGKYVFFCPIGLVHWVSPIIQDDMLKGAIVAGPVQMVEPEEFLIEDLLVKRNIKPEYLSAAKEALKTLPVINPEKVNSLSDLLAMVICFGYPTFKILRK